MSDTRPDNTDILMVEVNGKTEYIRIEEFRQGASYYNSPAHVRISVDDYQKLKPLLVKQTPAKAG